MFPGSDWSPRDDTLIKASITESRLSPTFTVSADGLLDLRLLRTSNRVGPRLDLEGTATHIRVATALAQCVHALLERIVFPAEQIVAVLAVAGARYTY
jgi:hypothetical protein